MPGPWELERHWPFGHMEIFVYRKPGGDRPAGSELPEHDPALLANEGDMPSEQEPVADQESSSEIDLEDSP